MNFPEFLKYSYLLSVPLFTILGLLLIKDSPSFSLRKYTVSESILHLKSPLYISIFRLNFIIKALLDFGFAVYVLNYFQIPYGSIISISLFVSAFLFGTLAYFTEGKHTTSHRVIVYTSGMLWGLGHILLVRSIGVDTFLVQTTVAIITPIVIGFWFLFTHKTNAIVQAICISIWYVWLWVFVSQYL